jgi:hypothetical protein
LLPPWFSLLLCQTSAFLELYGYWLSAGRLDAATGYVCFDAADEQQQQQPSADCEYLADLFARLQLPQLAAVAAGAHGYAVSASPTRFSICSQRWCDYFGAAYARVAADERL